MNTNVNADHYCLQWNNYQNSIVSQLDGLYSAQELIDVTISCDGKNVSAHKVVLSACSTYFREIFRQNPCKHPIVVLRDVKYDELEALLNFIYKGVVYIPEPKLDSFIKTASFLKIQGLSNINSENSKNLHTASTNDEKTNELSPPLPSQLLNNTNIISWNQRSTSSSISDKSSLNPFNTLKLSSAHTLKRKKMSNRMPVRYNTDNIDTNSNNDNSGAESDGQIFDQSLGDSEQRSNENYPIVGIKEESNESNKEDDNYESDENEEGNSDDRTKELLNQFSSASVSVVNANNFTIGSNSSKSTGDSNSSTGNNARFGRRPCPLCNKPISNKSNLLKHMRIRHSDQYNPAGCHLCDKVFKNKYSLRAHVNIYHKEETTGGGRGAAGGSRNGGGGGGGGSGDDTAAASSAVVVTKVVTSSSCSSPHVTTTTAPASTASAAAAAVSAVDFVNSLSFPPPPPMPPPVVSAPLAPPPTAHPNAVVQFNCNNNGGNNGAVAAASVVSNGNNGGCSSNGSSIGVSNSNSSGNVSVVGGSVICNNNMSNLDNNNMIMHGSPYTQLSNLNPMMSHSELNNIHGGYGGGGAHHFRPVGIGAHEHIKYPNFIMHHPGS